MMDSTQDGSVLSPEDCLPSNYRSIAGILECSNEEIARRPLVNVAGIVVDYRPPRSTHGQDWKSEVTLQEHTDVSGLKLNVFLPEKKQLHDIGAGDIILARKVKLSMWSGNISLMTHYSSLIFVLKTSSLSIMDAVLQKPQFYCYNDLVKAHLNPEEIRYAEQLSIQKDLIICPYIDEFETKTKQALNIKEKFSLLEDVRLDSFHDILVEVIQLIEFDGKLTMHATDYTSNELFYNREWTEEGIEEPASQSNSVYRKSENKSNKNWRGPWGKMAIQITLWDQHAAFVKDLVKEGDWVKLRNVHFKMGDQMYHLEGKLRAAQNDSWNKVQVDLVFPPVDEEDLSQDEIRYKDAIRRKRSYWQEHHKQKEEFLKHAAKETESKKRQQSEKDNAKTRRKRARQKLVSENADSSVLSSQPELGEDEETLHMQDQTSINRRIDINVNVTSSNTKMAPVPLSVVLGTNKQIYSAKDGVDYRPPFNNTNHRAIIRVIDYKPDKVEDFAYGRRPSDYDVLSDYSGDDDNTPETNMRLFREGKGHGGNKVWEWAFRLLVEDAHSETEKKRLWLDVSNDSAQMLLDMDASNLRLDRDNLDSLRDKLFTLWGDLEEQKIKLLDTKARAEKLAEKENQSSQVQIEPRTMPGEMPSLNSDNEDNSSRAVTVRNEAIHKSRGNAKEKAVEVDDFAAKAVIDLPIRNKPFICCIRQYGIKVKADDPTKCDAGPGKMYKRRFGLFDTQIA